MVRVEMVRNGIIGEEFVPEEVLLDWLDLYCSGYWTSHPSSDKLSRVFYFSDQDVSVAMLFKLSWGGV